MIPPNRVCVKCLLTDRTPGISFDREGVCSICRTYTPMSVMPEEELVEILDSFRSARGKYDCMLGISGGRDSTYTLWKLVKDYNMRVLAVNYENPFTSEQAKENMRKAFKILNVDVATWRFPNDAHRRTTVKGLRIWAHRPSSAMIPLVCGCCNTAWRALFGIARKHGIRLVVMGSNPLETASFKKASFGGSRTYHKVRNIPRMLATGVREIVLNPWNLTTSWRMVLRLYLESSHSAPYARWRYKDLTVVRLFDYLRWDEKEVMSTIAENLGWKKSDEVASSWRFDCRLDYVRRLMYASTTGVTELRDLFSKMIREGVLEREDALERLKTEDLVPEAVVDDILQDLGLKLSDLNLGVVRNLLS